MNIKHNKISKSITRWINDITKNEFNKVLFIVTAFTMGLYILLLGLVLLIFLWQLPSIITGTLDTAATQYWGIAFIPLILAIYFTTPIGIICLIVLAIRTKSKVLLSLILAIVLIFISFALAYDFQF